MTALFNIFKKKEKKKTPKKTPKLAKAEETAELKEIKPEIPKPHVKREEVIYRTILYPHITEKATNLTKEDQYIFRVKKGCGKNEIKKAVESMYGINVVNVRVINIPPKEVRLGKNKGWKKGYRKAIVKIKKGQKIELLPR